MGRDRDPAVRVATAVLCLPGLAAVIVAIRDGWLPTSDSATIATRAFDVLTDRSPLVGQYSLATGDGETATHSLGPLLYWVLALPVRVAPVAPALAMASINTAALVGSMRLAARHGGRALGLGVAVGLVVLVRSLGLGHITSIWNPAAAVLPFVALVWVVWAMTDERPALLPWAVALGSLVLQCHLTYLGPVAVLAVATVIALVRGPRPTGVGLAVVVLVAVACWVAPVAEQLGGERGNLTRIATAVDGERVGAVVGLDAAGRALAGPPAWWHRSGTRRLSPRNVVAPLALPARLSAVAILAAVVAVTIAARRRHDRKVATLGGLTLGLLAAVALVASQLPRDRAIVAGYSLWWSQPVGMLAWLVVIWGGLRWWGPSLDGARSPALVVAGALAVAGLVATVPSRDPFAWTYAPSAAFADAAASSAERGGRYQVEAGELGVVLPAAIGFRLRTEGVDAVLPAEVGLATGEGYSQRGQRCDGILEVVPSGSLHRRGRVLVSAVINPPDLPAGRWDLVLAPDGGDPSC